MRRLLLLATAALLLAAHGCGGCGGCGGLGGAGGGFGRLGGSPELARVVPRDADLVVLVPDLGALGVRLRRLEQLKLASVAAQLQGAGNASELVGSLMFQLGVDLRDRESMERAGLDPRRGAAAVFLKSGGAYAVVAVKDEKALRETVRRLARDRLGAGAMAETGAAGQRAFAFSRAPGGPPELTLLFRDGFGFVAQRSVAERLPALAALPEGEALSAEAEYRKALARLPAERQVLVRVPPTSSYSRPGAMHGSLVSLALGEGALAIFTTQPWPNTQQSSAFLRPAGPAADLLGLAAPDAFLVARSAGSPAGLGPIWPVLAGRYVENAVQQSGFDIQGEIFDNLKPGPVLSLSLAPTVNLATRVTRLDVRGVNPFGFVHLVVAGEVKDAGKAAQTLERIPQVAGRFGAQVTPSTREGQRVYLTRYSQGEGAHLALAGDKALMAAPASRLDEVMARARDGKPAEGLAADPAHRPFLEAHPLAVVVDLRRLADAVRELPSSAWGVGGFAMKATALRWLDATDDLRAVTFRASEADGMVEAELRLHLQSPAPPPSSQGPR